MSKSGLYLLIAGGVLFWFACCAPLFGLRNAWRPLISPVPPAPAPDQCAPYQDKIDELEDRLFWLQRTHCGDLPESGQGCDMATDELEDEERVARETPYLPPQ